MIAQGLEPLPLKKVEAVFRTQKDGKWEEWEVLQFEVNESLCEPYIGSIEIASRTRTLDFSELLGRSCELELRRGADRRRLFKGMCFRIEHLGNYPAASVGRIGFAAAMWSLRQGKNSRIFEGATAVQIIAEEFQQR